MRVLVNLENTDDFREIYVEENEPIESLKYIIEAEFSVPFSEQDLSFKNTILKEDKLFISHYKINEDDIILLKRKTRPQFDFNTNQLNSNSLPATNSNNSLSNIFDNTMKMLKNNPGVNNQPSNNMFNKFSLDSQILNECKNLKELYMNKPNELNMLFNTDTELAEVIVSMDDKKLEDLVRTRITKFQDKKKKDMDEYMKLMNADSNDADAQMKIEELIKRKNIEENFQMAQEYLPETFLPVHMLFINLEINKKKIVALVDTGAQTTIISEDLAKKCGVYNLCDTRYHGIAKGVGLSKIIGVVHAAQLKIGKK